jgi:hypothetical protein
MPQAMQITNPKPYASRDDFRQVFDEDMNTLYLLSYLLTADREKAEQCFVSGLEDAVDGNPVFQEWARSWARRVIIVNAVRAINPRPMEENSPSSSAALSGNVKTPAVKQVEMAAVLALDPFERFVYVMTVLERYSDQDCSLLLGCVRRALALSSGLEARWHPTPGSSRLPVRKNRYRMTVAVPRLSCWLVPV